MELETSFLVHQSISSSYIQQHSLMSIPSLLPIRSTITQPLPRPFRHLSLYAAQSPSHSHAHSVTCLYTQHNHPATPTSIPSLVSIRSTIAQPLSRLSRHLSPYVTKSTSQSLAYPVTCPHSQQKKSASHSHAHSVTCPHTQQNQPATLVSSFAFPSL